MKSFKESADEINGSKVVLKKICELCGKPLKLYQRNFDRPHKFVFINIAQEPAKHYFCSKRCKNEWIFNPTTTNEQQIIDLKTA